MFSHCNINIGNTPPLIFYNLFLQADNQLLGTRHPVIFHVIPSKKECPDNTPAIHIAAVKLPKTEWNADIFKVKIFIQLSGVFFFYTQSKILSLSGTVSFWFVEEIVVPIENHQPRQ